MAGFKDFITPGPQGSAKFSSAAAILGYLSGQHKTAARHCIIKYFQVLAIFVWTDLIPKLCLQNWSVKRLLGHCKMITGKSLTVMICL